MVQGQLGGQRTHRYLRGRRHLHNPQFIRAASQLFDPLRAFVLGTLVGTSLTQ